MKTPPIGSIVECVFLDHVEDGDTPLSFAVYGVLTRCDDTALVIESWRGTDDYSQSEEQNQKKWCIVRSCIQSLSRLMK